MVIYVSVQYEGGFLPEIILLTLSTYVIALGNPFHTMESCFPYSQQCSHQIQPEYGDEQADAGRDG